MHCTTWHSTRQTPTSYSRVGLTAVFPFRTHGLIIFFWFTSFFILPKCLCSPDQVQLFENLTLFYKCCRRCRHEEHFFPTPFVRVVEAMQKKRRGNVEWDQERMYKKLEVVALALLQSWVDLSPPAGSQQPLLTRTTFTEGFYTHIPTHAQIQTHTLQSCKRESDIRRPDKTSFWSEFQKEHSPCSCI